MTDIKRRVFYSFYYNEDVRRVSQIKMIADNMGIATPNEWEEVKRRGEKAIQNWIDNHMYGSSCVIVLVGEHTYKSTWVKYEIKKAVEENKPIFGIYIHNLKDPNGEKSAKGQDPFFFLGIIRKIYNPDPNDACGDIMRNLDKWIENAIQRSN